MRTNFRFAAVVAIMGMMTELLTGCAGTVAANADNPPKALSVVIGNHMCSRELNLNSPLIMEEVSDTIADYGFISVVSVDGSPSLVAADSYDIPDQYKNAAPAKLRADAENKAHNLMMQISNVKADDAEVDTLEAIRIAVRSLVSAPEGARRTIIVVDTGWSTTGLLNFGNNLLNAEPESIANMLLEKQAIPDLKGTTVIWQQLGDVANPQQELSPSQTVALEATWRAVIESGGGTFICSETVPNNGVIGEGLPGVSTVELPEERPVAFDEVMTGEEGMSFDEPVLFGEEQIRFKGDSSEFDDPDKAKANIEPIAAYMDGHPKFRLLLVGTTAGDDDSEFARRLSYERANAVRISLIEMGIDGERISVIGQGSHDKWHIYGAGTKGELAAQNRKVVMMDLDTDEAFSMVQEER